MPACRTVSQFPETHCGPQIGSLPNDAFRTHQGSGQRGAFRFARDGITITAAMFRAAGSDSAVLVAYAWSAISSWAGTPSGRAGRECGSWAFPGASVKPASCHS